MFNSTRVYFIISLNNKIILPYCTAVIKRPYPEDIQFHGYTMHYSRWPMAISRPLIFLHVLKQMCTNIAHKGVSIIHKQPALYDCEWAIGSRVYNMQCV